MEYETVGTQSFKGVLTEGIWFSQRIPVCVLSLDFLRVRLRLQFKVRRKKTKLGFKFDFDFNFGSDSISGQNEKSVMNNQLRRFFGSFPLVIYKKIAKRKQTYTKILNQDCRKLLHNAFGRTSEPGSVFPKCCMFNRTVYGIGGTSQTANFFQIPLRFYKTISERLTRKQLSYKVWISSFTNANVLPNVFEVS